MLAQRVHLADRRAGRQQRTRHRLLLARAKCRAPARSSWPMRRPTPAPARDRRRRRRRRARACRASPRGRPHPAPGARLRPAAPRASVARSRAASPQSRRCDRPAARTCRDSAARRFRSWRRPPCRPRARSAVPTVAAAADAASGSRPDAPPRPRCGRAPPETRAARVVTRRTQRRDFQAWRFRAQWAKAKIVCRRACR